MQILNIFRVPKVDRLWVVCVLVPTLLAIAYFGFIASDVYVSESRYVVRSADKQTTSALGALLKAPGVSVAGDEVDAVQEYVRSRDALVALNKDGFFDRLISTQSLSWVERSYAFGFDNTFESKYKFFQKRVDVANESSSSISILKVRAYRPEDAYQINKRLLDLGEALVNRLNSRSREDLIRSSLAEVASAREQAQRSALALAAFRNRSGVIDPEQQAEIQLQLISKLQDELISAKNQLGQLQTYTPSNPQIPVLRTRIAALSTEIDNAGRKIIGDSKSISSANVEYRRLTLESEFSEKNLASSLASLESAKNEARRKQVYLERIVMPNIPDEASEPRRLRAIFSTLALGLVAWGVLSMLLAGLREHRD